MKAKAVTATTKQPRQGYTLSMENLHQLARTAAGVGVGIEFDMKQPLVGVVTKATVDEDKGQLIIEIENLPKRQDGHPVPAFQILSMAGDRLEEIEARLFSFTTQPTEDGLPPVMYEDA